MVVASLDPVNLISAKTWSRSSYRISGTLLCLSLCSQHSNLQRAIAEEGELCREWFIFTFSNHIWCRTWVFLYSHWLLWWCTVPELSLHIDRPHSPAWLPKDVQIFCTETEKPGRQKFSLCQVLGDEGMNPCNFVVTTNYALFKHSTSGFDLLYWCWSIYLCFASMDLKWYNSSLFEPSSVMTISNLASSEAHLWPAHRGTSLCVLLLSSLQVSALPLAILLII